MCVYSVTQWSDYSDATVLLCVFVRVVNMMTDWRVWSPTFLKIVNYQRCYSPTTEIVKSSSYLVVLVSVRRYRLLVRLRCPKVQGSIASPLGRPGPRVSGSVHLTEQLLPHSDPSVLSDPSLVQQPRRGKSRGLLLLWPHVRLLSGRASARAVCGVSVMSV